MQFSLEEFAYLATSTATSKLMTFKLQISIPNLFSHQRNTLAILALKVHLPISTLCLSSVILATSLQSCVLAPQDLPGPEMRPWPHHLIMRDSPCALLPPAAFLQVRTHLSGCFSNFPCSRRACPYCLLLRAAPPAPRKGRNLKLLSMIPLNLDQ